MNKALSFLNETLKDSPLLYWAVGKKEQDFQISNKLSQLLGLGDHPNLETFEQGLITKDYNFFQEIKNSKVISEVLNFTHKNEGKKIKIEYQFQKIGSFTIAWGTQLLDELSLEKELQEKSIQLYRNTKLLQALQDVQSKVWDGSDYHQAFSTLLSKLLDITGSEYGFIGEVLRKKDHTPYLKTHAINNIAWSKDTREFHQTHAPLGMDFHNLKTLFGRVMSHDEVVIANNPYQDKRRGGLPEGQPPLNAFLGIPVHYQNELVGMLGIANRDGGYNQDLVDFLQPFLVTYGTLIKNLNLRNKQSEQKEELILAQSRAEHTLAVQSRLVRNISHELRTPLSLILGPISALLQTAAEDYNLPDLKDKLHLAKKETEKLVKIVDSILDLSTQNLLKNIQEPTSLFLFMKGIFDKFIPKTEAG